MATLRSVGNAPATSVGRRVGDHDQIHSLDVLSNEQEAQSGSSLEDVEAGKIKVVTVLEQYTEQVCDSSYGASDRKLVSPGRAF